MKYIVILILLAFAFTSCGDNKGKVENQEGQKAQEEISEKGSTEIEKSYEWNYYAGTLGFYGDNVVLEIAVDSNKIVGGYWYLKHGKKLTLTGETVPKSSEWKLTESYNNKITGAFVLENKGDSLIGTWSAPNSKEAQPVALRRVLKNKTEQVPLEFEKYIQKHTIVVYGMDEDMEEEVQDAFLCVRLGNYLLFSYDVTGANAHMGFIDGLAQMKTENKAVFKGEMDCELTINFKGNTVEIDENSCHYYRGARAYFSGQLTKQH